MIAAIVFLSLLLTGFPIFAAILAGAIAFMIESDLAIFFDSIPIQLYGALEINGLLAIPLFMLVGEIMNKADLTRRLIAVAELLLGTLRGGLAYANLFTNAMAASILGSAVAQIGVMSKAMIPEMERRGYPRHATIPGGRARDAGTRHCGAPAVDLAALAERPLNPARQHSSTGIGQGQVSQHGITVRAFESCFWHAAAVYALS